MGTKSNDRNPRAMGTLESLVVRIQGLSSNEEDLSLLHKLLKQARDSLQSPQARVLARHLDQLDPSSHSLGYLYFLDAYMSAAMHRDAFTSAATTKERVSKIVPIVARFLNSCKAEQIRLAANKFICVCKRFKDVVIMLQMPISGVAPLQTAVRKLRSSSGQLTALHPEFLSLCLLAKSYKAGISILEEDIFEINHPTEFFLYCYYGGMICIGQKRFHKAKDLLYNCVVTAPMSKLNAIAVEAYKKYILISLIRDGQFLNILPKDIAASTSRAIKYLCKHYYDLADSYGTGQISELEICLKTNGEKFINDNNLGLVKQVVSSLHKRSIQRLTQTYLTLSLQDIANSAQLSTSKEAEMHVIQMIQDGEIFATINQKDGMVNFHEDPEQYKSCKMIEHIDSSIQRIMTLSRKLSAVDEQISCDAAYLGRVGKDCERFDLDDHERFDLDNHQRFDLDALDELPCRRHA